MKVFLMVLVLSSMACSAEAGRSAVVQVETLEGGRGTGFFVTRNLVMTNHHVVRGGEMMIIHHRTYKVWGQVVAVEPGLDLALIEVKGKGPRPLTFCGDTMEGDEVYVWTWDFGRFREKRGMVESRWFERVVTTIGLIPGNSGSPMLKGRGLRRCVAGVAKAVSIPDMRGIATSAFAAREFLRVYLVAK